LRMSWPVLIAVQDSDVAVVDEHGDFGAGAALAQVDVVQAAVVADPDGGLSVDENFLPHGEEFRGLRVHQIRLQGGDASSDSYCYS
jgi:methanethiol oxidase